MMPVNHPLPTAAKQLQQSKEERMIDMNYVQKPSRGGSYENASYIHGLPAKR